MTLILAAALWLTLDGQFLGSDGFGHQGQIMSLLTRLLVAATLAAPWFAPRGVTVLLAAGTTAALGIAIYHIVQPASLTWLTPVLIPPLGAPLVLGIAGAAGQARPPRAWLWLPGGLLAASALFYGQHMVSTTLASSLIGLAGTVIACGIACATLLWLTVDARPAIAFIIGWEWLLVPRVLPPPSRGSGSAAFTISLPWPSRSQRP